MSTGTLQRPRRLAASLVLLLVSACTTIEPSVAPQGSGAAPSPPAPAGATTAPGSAQLSRPTAADLINAAYQAGTLDLATALLYRLQAEVGDDRLPAAYLGEPEEDGAAALAVEESWGQFTVEQQAALLPYLVRPSDARSIWAEKAAADSEAATLVSAHWRLTAAECRDGFALTGGSSGTYVVWAQCAGASPSASTAARAAETATYLDQLWQGLVAYMGPPKGDDAPVAEAEVPDRRIDVYVIDTEAVAHERTIATAALASARRTTPRSAAEGWSSGYMVVGPGAGSGGGLKSTIAHELFHILQFAHNSTGVFDPLYGDQGANHWFMEASAVWAEHEFVADARAAEVYPRLGRFAETALGLPSLSGTNEYAAWLWPLFMHQEKGRAAVADAWKALEGRRGFDAWQDGLATIVPFETRFRDFAVRAYNGPLLRGDPIRPRFQDLAGAGMPMVPPIDPRGTNGVTSVGDEPPDRQAYLDPLWSQYVDLVVDPDVMQVEFDFSDLNPQSFLDVDLLVLPRGREWERRTADSGPFCDVERIIVILSNHADNESTTGSVRGTWTASGRAEPCPRAAWRATLSGGYAGAGEYSGNGDVYCSRAAGGWSVTVITAGSGLKSLSFGEDPGSFMAVTGTESDTPADWFWSSFFPNGSVRIEVVKAEEPIELRAIASWNDGTHQFDADVRVTCSPMPEEDS